ncbi:hypothetical protein FH972_019746 [Carpinus fangiana]|uniref:Uncharacterized protein n=1 Tax=Carpinus fangiana TaxID=176857 RepID=A0A5N6RUL7_9ROSI|nr:hypothetical protein FH972_019746 [Carpinus fangiana]
MGEVKDNDYKEELVDFEDDDPKALDSASARPFADTAKKLEKDPLHFKGNGEMKRIPFPRS